jgi:hypothetical protein
MLAPQLRESRDLLEEREGPLSKLGVEPLMDEERSVGARKNPARENFLDPHRLHKALAPGNAGRACFRPKRGLSLAGQIA